MGVAGRELTVALRLQSDMARALRDLEAVDNKLQAVGRSGAAVGKADGLDGITTGARNVSAAVDAAKATVDRLAQAVRAASTSGSETSPFIAALREQVALYGKSTEEVLRYRAAQAGVGSEAAPLILQLQNQRAAQQAAAQAAMEEAAAQRSAAAERQQVAATQQQFIGGLREQVALQGKSQADVLRYRAGALGVGGDAEKYIADIERFNRANASGAKSLHQVGVSAGQTAAALRMLPAQFTDVATSLAGGQSPLLVLLQQGGQIKDSFGGVRPALAALASYVTPVAVSVTALAAGVGLMAAAFLAGQEQVRAFNVAVQTTSNFAGATRANIEALATAAANTTGISRGAAREVATAMVASGRLGIDTIGNLTRAVQGYAATTGTDAARAGAALTESFARPAEGALKLNQQFHFLSLEHVRYIQRLVDQGRTEAAQLELSKRFADHIGGAYVNNLGVLERAWHGVANAAKNAWDKMLSVGRGSTVDDQIAQARNAVAALQAQVTSAGTSANDVGGSKRAQAALELAAAQARLAGLETSKAASQAAAAQAAQRAQTEQRRIEIDQGLKGLEATVRTNRQKIEAEKVKLDEALKLGVIDQAKYDSLLAAVRERNKGPAAPRRAADPVATAFASQELALTQQRAEAQQRLDNMVAGTTARQDQATAKLEAWLATSAEAKKLDDGRVKTLRTLAAAIDAANRSTADIGDQRAGAERAAAELRTQQEREAVEQKRRQERIASGMASVDVALLRATGRQAEASAAEIEARYRKLRDDLAAAGDFTGLAKVADLAAIDLAAAVLGELQARVDQVLGNLSRAEADLQAQVAVGALAEVDAKQKLLGLNVTAAQQIEALLPRMRELARLSGDPRMAAGVEDLAVRTAQLKVQANELQVAFQGAFQSSFANALQGLADGTKSLGDAAKGFLLDLANGMAQWAAQALAAKATAALMASLTNTGSGATGAATAAVQSEAMAAAGVAAGAALGEGAIAVDTAAGAVMLAGADLVVSATALDAAGVVVMAAAAAMTDAAAAMAAAAAVQAASGFASGGYTGPGHKYQVAGVVHAGEFVHRQEVVRQPGALAFLSQFNRHGMAAVQAWQGPGYATGGLVVPVSAGASAAAAYQPVTVAPGTTNVQVQQRLLPVLDDNLIADALRGPKGEELLVLHISRNPGKFRAILKV